jgi:hypothetical protein
MPLKEKNEIMNIIEEKMDKTIKEWVIFKLTSRYFLFSDIYFKVLSINKWEVLTLRLDNEIEELFSLKDIENARKKWEERKKEVEIEIIWNYDFTSLQNFIEDKINNDFWKKRFFFNKKDNEFTFFYYKNDDNHTISNQENFYKIEYNIPFIELDEMNEDEELQVLEIVKILQEKII